MDAVGLPVGTRVKLRPRAGGDVFDLALAGKTAVVDVVETDMEGRVFVGVLVDDDPGRDLGERGHRFFFSPAEVVPLRVLVGGDRQRLPRRRRVRVRAGAARVASTGVDVVDFGIRGMDLAYALADYDVVVFLDATPRGERARDALRDRARPRRAAARRRRPRDAPGDGAGAGQDARRRAAADARARVRAGRRWRSSPSSASRCGRRWTRPRSCSNEVLRKET